LSAVEPPEAGGNTLLVVNKSDLAQDPRLSGVPGIRVSALTGEGIEQLLAAMKAWIEDRLVSDADEAGLVASVRQIEALEALRGALARAEAALLVDTPLEAALVDLRDALRLAGNVVGGSDVSELVLDRIFATFCLGK
jgi:tRNA U34 5-carboxymethylaminomethyl modifying GTPase MnmE/TrmE